MNAKTTFHIEKNTFYAIVDRGQRDIIVAARSDVQANEPVNICCDELKQAITAEIELIEHSSNHKHKDTMVIVIKAVEALDYAYVA